MAKAKSKSVRRDYPKPDEMRTGIKVAWNIYNKRVDAVACSEAAIKNAQIQFALGYDFGYCSPGSITELPDGRFEVCIP